MAIERKWFEMKDVKGRSLTKAVWIPLCAYDASSKVGDYGHIGYKAEYFSAIAVMLPAESYKAALTLDWTCVSRNHSHRPCVQNGKFLAAGTFQSYGKHEIAGNYPVLQQRFEAGESEEWHLDQEIVLGLNLYREGDKWISPEEDYLEVARIKRDHTGKLLRLEIRSEHIQDFLCAKNAGLLVSTYQSRQVVVETEPDFGWNDEIAQEKGEHYRWEGRIVAIHEGGHPYGKKTGVFHMGRTNMDLEEDVPTYGAPGDDDVEHSSWEIEHKGKKLFRVIGEMWRNEWIAPAKVSPRVKDDMIEPRVHFIVDASGTTRMGNSLEGNHGWLWFKPDVVPTLLKKRRGFLKWHTEDTGEVGPAPQQGVHFGVNNVGLINVLAKDIALLPEIWQKVWAGYNISPDGGVSRELTKSQMEAKPADTIAPESLLEIAIAKLQEVSVERFGQDLLRNHKEEERIAKNIHRFHGQSLEGVCYLAKDLSRLIMERIDVSLLKSLDQDAGSDIGSIKRLEHYLTSKGHDGRSLTSVLVGVHSLRIRDAHLLSSDIEEALTIVGITERDDYLSIAKEMVAKVAVCLLDITKAIDQI